MAAAPDFTSVRSSAPSGKFSAFWRWWTGELANLVPERISMLGGGARAPLLALEGDVVKLLEPRGSAMGEEGTIVLSALDEPRRKAAVHALLERAGEPRGRARILAGTHHPVATARHGRGPARDRAALSRLAEARNRESSASPRRQGQRGGRGDRCDRARARKAGRRLQLPAREEARHVSRPRGHGGDLAPAARQHLVVADGHTDRGENARGGHRGRDRVRLEADRDPREVDVAAERGSAWLRDPRLAAGPRALPDRGRGASARAARSATGDGSGLDGASAAPAGATRSTRGEMTSPWRSRT